jgi:hypothetical protein
MAGSVFCYFKAIGTWGGTAYGREGQRPRARGAHLMIRSNESKQTVDVDLSGQPPKEVFLAGEFLSFFR